MASKGDKAKLYDVAMRMYAEGESLTNIEAAIGVSRQTLSSWKADTRRPGDDADAWDKARQVKRNGVQRVLDLYYRELGFLEDQPAGSLSSTQVDAISKLGALVMKWEQRDKEIRRQEREATKKEAVDTLENIADAKTIKEFRKRFL